MDKPKVRIEQNPVEQSKIKPLPRKQSFQELDDDALVDQFLNNKMPQQPPKPKYEPPKQDVYYDEKYGSESVGGDIFGYTIRIESDMPLWKKGRY